MVPRVVRFLYDPADINSLGNNYASTLSKDWEGNIWIGTFGSGFINIYEREKAFCLSMIQIHLIAPGYGFDALV